MELPAHTNSPRIGNMVNNSEAVVVVDLHMCGKVPVSRQQISQRRKTDDILPISRRHKPPTCLFSPQDTPALFFWSTGTGPPSPRTPNIPAISPLLQNQDATPMYPISHSSFAAAAAPGLRLRLLPLLPPLAPPPLPPLAPPPCFTPGGGLTNAKSTCTV